MTIKEICPVCEKPATIEVDDEKFKLWQNGLVIQKAFPELTPDERELLITGIHSECWDKMFPGEE